MNNYSLLIWIVDGILITCLTLVLWKRNFWSKYPVFLAFCGFDVLRTWGLFVLRPETSLHVYSAAYFYAYWASDALLQLLLICAVQELFVLQLAPFPVTVKFGKIAFYGVLGAALVTAIVSASIDPGIDEFPIVGAVINLELILRIVQSILLLFAALFSLKFGLNWTNDRLKLVIGMGVLTISELLVVAVRASLGQLADHFFRIFKPTVFAFAVSFWIWGFLRKSAPIVHSKPPSATQLEALNRELRRALR